MCIYYLNIHDIYSNDVDVYTIYANLLKIIP